MILIDLCILCIFGLSILLDKYSGQSLDDILATNIENKTLKEEVNSAMTIKTACPHGHTNMLDLKSSLERIDLNV